MKKNVALFKSDFNRTPCYALVDDFSIIERYCEFNFINYSFHEPQIDFNDCGDVLGTKCLFISFDKQGVADIAFYYFLPSEYDKILFDDDEDPNFRLCYSFVSFLDERPPFVTVPSPFTGFEECFAQFISHGTEK